MHEQETRRHEAETMALTLKETRILKRLIQDAGSNNKPSGKPREKERERDKGKSKRSRQAGKGASKVRGRRGQQANTAAKATKGGRGPRRQRTTNTPRQRPAVAVAVTGAPAQLLVKCRYNTRTQAATPTR